ncbi:MAG: hypothetical protein ABF242_00240 [Flavobacteriales bacterium]
MSIWKRIRVYAVGFGIGLIITSYFFGDRGGCNIFPGKDVKKNIMTTKFNTSEYLDCKLVCNGFTANSIVDIIVNGDVIFSESDVQSKPREYVLRLDDKKLVFAVDPRHYEPTYLIDDFEKDCGNCDSLSKDLSRNIKLPFKKK